MNEPHQPPGGDPFGATFQPIPLAELRTRVLTLYQPPLRAYTTFLSVRRSLDLLMQLDGLETTADLTTATIARFVIARHGLENPNTTRTHLRKLSAVCEIAHGEGWLRVNPFKIRRGWVRSVTPKAPRIHSREELARVLALAVAEIAQTHPGQRWKARRLYALVATAAYTGMRKTECLTLRVEDLRIRDRIIDLRARADQRFKTDAAAEPVPMPETLAKILRGWVGHVGGSEFVFPNTTRGGPWIGGPMGGRPLDALQALGQRADVPGLTFQSLRHCWATHAEFWGLTDAQIQRVLRHTNPKTQQRYRHAELENMRRMVERIDFEAPPADPPRDVADRARETRARTDCHDSGPVPTVDPAMVDYRVIPGFPRHRLGSDRSVWTNLRRDGHERPGDAPGPWRRVLIHRPERGDAERVNLRRDGRTRQRTVAALMRLVFGEPDS